MSEHVVLVDANNRHIGLADKVTIHTNETPLHRGFSLFSFNSHGQLLLQQRAQSKITWPGVWSNSVCGHPADGETAQQAAKRRAEFELGIEVALNDIEVFVPDYKYRYEHNGVVEHEICPILGVVSDVLPRIKPQEVEDTVWIAWPEFVAQTQQPNAFSPWCVEETQLLVANKQFQQFYQKILST